MAFWSLVLYLANISICWHTSIFWQYYLFPLVLPYSVFFHFPVTFFICPCGSFIPAFSFFIISACSSVSQGADVTDPGTETEESLGASDSTQRPADSQTPSRKIQETLSKHTQIHLRLSTFAHKLSRLQLLIWHFMRTLERCNMLCVVRGRVRAKIKSCLQPGHINALFRKSNS